MRINNNIGTTVTVAPTTTAISVQDVIDYARLDNCGETSFIEMLIGAATEQAEAYMRRKIVTQTLQSSYDFPPSQSFKTAYVIGDTYSYRGQRDDFTLPFAPVQSVSSIKTYSPDNVESVYASTNYIVDTINARIFFNNDATLPSNLRNHNAMIVEYVAGYTTIPNSIKLGLLEQVKAMYECRGTCDMCDIAKIAFAPYRLFDMEM